MVTGLGLIFIFAFSSLRESDSVVFLIPDYIPIVSFAKRISVQVASLCLSTLSVMVVANKLVRRTRYSTPSGLVFFLAFQSIFFFKLYFVSDDSLFLAKLVFAFLLFIVFAYGVQLWNRTNSTTFLLKYFVWGVAAFVLLNVLQFISDPHSVSWKGRMFGITNHPNFFGVTCSLSTLAVIAIIGTIEHARNKILLSILAFLLVIGCFASGSRTSVLSLFAGASVVMFLSSQKPVHLLFSLAVGVGLIAGIWALDLTSFGLQPERVYSQENTRAITWSVMASDFLNSPIWGADRPSDHTSNSFLRAASVTGIVGLIFLILSQIAVLSKLVELRRREASQQFRGMLGALIGILSALNIASVFEGTLTESYSFSLLTFYAVASIAYSYRPKVTAQV